MLVSTPTTKPQENVFACRTDIDLNIDGGGKATTNILGKGEYKFHEVNYFNQRTDDEKRFNFIRRMDWKQPDNVTIVTGDRSETPYKIIATMAYDQLYSFKAGSKMFLPLRMYPIFSAFVPATLKRKHNYYFEHPYQLFDTTVYHLPDSVNVESLPKDKSLATSFGKYNSHYSYNTDSKTVTILTALEICQYIIPVEKYADLQAFKKYLDEDMNEKLVVRQF